MLEIGRICLKTAGREAGKKCVVLERIDENFVLVIGPEVRKRRCNVKHLEPLPQVIEVKGKSDEEIKKEIEKLEETG